MSFANFRETPIKHNSFKSLRREIEDTAQTMRIMRETFEVCVLGNDLPPSPKTDSEKILELLSNINHILERIEEKLQEW